MHRINLIIKIMLLTLLISSCIKRFDPEIKSSDSGKFVVTGLVTDLMGNQKVTVSMTSPIGEPKYIPIALCTVTIIDDKGNRFEMIDMYDGNYYASIDPAYLTPGTSFKVEVFTPGGIHLVSDFEMMNECPEVDSIYYIRKDLPTTDPERFIKGIQFYIDLDANQTAIRYFRWEETETWEYHTDYPLIWWYDGELHQVSPPDYSKHICWVSSQVKNIYALSTKDLVVNKYQQLPLHFVDNKTTKLAYGYYLLVKQFSLSEAAYNYWDQLRINGSGQGGLYQKQPLAIKGNMHNLTNPDEEVLGFFGASSVKAKPMFVRNVENLPMEYNNVCSPTQVREGGFRNFGPLDYPVYLLGDQFGLYSPLTQLNPECVDCTAGGGTNIKPSYWPY